jgi:hypothetical protein
MNNLMQELLNDARENPQDSPFVSWFKMRELIKNRYPEKADILMAEYEDHLRERINNLFQTCDEELLLENVEEPLTSFFEQVSRLPFQTSSLFQA